MEIHSFIGQILTAIAEVLALMAGVAALLLIARAAWVRVEEHQDADLDVVGSQYVTDGKWDWSKGDLPKHQQGAPRHRINIAAYRNGDTVYDPLKGDIGPDDEEEGPDEVAVEVIDFDIPDYVSLKEEMTYKPLKPRLNGDHWR